MDQFIAGEHVRDFKLNKTIYLIYHQHHLTKNKCYQDLLPKYPIKQVYIKVTP
jgi:hypothetical protein